MTTSRPLAQGLLAALLPALLLAPASCGSSASPDPGLFAAPSGGASGDAGAPAQNGGSAGSGAAGQGSSGAAGAGKGGAAGVGAGGAAGAGQGAAGQAGAAAAGAGQAGQGQSGAGQAGAGQSGAGPGGAGQAGAGQGGMDAGGAGQGGGASGAPGGAAGAGAMSSGVRDWAKYPPIVQVDTSEDILAVGDIHGDYDRLVALLSATQVIAGAPAAPGEVKWAAGKAVLVCTGDVIDKWTHALDALTLLQALSADAQASGGRVIVTMGNHEAEFLADPTNSKSVDFQGELTAAGMAPADVASGANPLGQYLRSLPFAARVSGWFFSHASETHGKTLTDLGAELQAGVDASGFSAMVLLDPSSLLEEKLSMGVWWEASGDPQGLLGMYTQALGVQHLVMGHQPGKVNFADGSNRAKGTLFQQYGQIFLIDVGMSQGVDDSQGVLLRVHSSGGVTTATGFYPDGTSTMIWQG